jgi:hypothetical protein
MCIRVKSDLTLAKVASIAGLHTQSKQGLKRSNLFTQRMLILLPAWT